MPIGYNFPLTFGGRTTLDRHNEKREKQLERRASGQIGSQNTQVDKTYKQTSGHADIYIDKPTQYTQTQIQLTRRGSHADK